MNPKEKDDEIIELTDKELDGIFADDDFDNGEDGCEIRSFYFSNPGPYANVEPRPDDARKREFSFDGKGSRQNHSIILQPVRRGHKGKRRQRRPIELHSASADHVTSPWTSC